MTVFYIIIGITILCVFGFLIVVYSEPKPIVYPVFGSTTFCKACGNVEGLLRKYVPANIDGPAYPYISVICPKCGYSQGERLYWDDSQFIEKTKENFTTIRQE